jgi:uncharacterized membrane protein
MKPVLLAGETFLVTSTVAKGYDVGSSHQYVNGATQFIAALAARDIEVRQIGGERCETDFPASLEALREFSAVVLSDVGALSLYFSPQTRAGHPSVDRLELLRKWVESGGGLIMAGGYTSFQGMDGMARYHDTPVEDCLPVNCLPHSDGLEAPEGLTPEIVAGSNAHPILRGVGSPFPLILGMNKVVLGGAASDLILLCRHRGREQPLLACQHYGKGRSVAWMSDIGPHWLSRSFLSWRHYGQFMANMVSWVAGQD